MKVFRTFLVSFLVVSLSEQNIILIQAKFWLLQRNINNNIPVSCHWAPSFPGLHTRPHSLEENCTCALNHWKWSTFHLPVSWLVTSVVAQENHIPRRAIRTDVFPEAVGPRIKLMAPCWNVTSSSTCSTKRWFTCASREVVSSADVHVYVEG